LKQKGLKWILASWWNYFVFFIKRKDKRYKIWGRTRFEGNTATVPWQQHQKACWYFLTKEKEPASAQNYRCIFHPEVFRVSYYSQGTEVLLLSNSYKDNTRVKLERVEMDSYYFWVYEKINSTSTCLLWVPAYT
jgi:hypothetical protein